MPIVSSKLEKDVRASVFNIIKFPLSFLSFSSIETTARAFREKDGYHIENVSIVEIDFFEPFIYSFSLSNQSE